MTQQTTAALPCPFCGGDKVSIHEGSTYRWARAECDECGASAGDIRRQYGQGVDDPEVIADAIAEWNKRDRREIDRLERDLRIALEMHGQPTPIYDKLKAEGLEPPATVMLVGEPRELTDDERTFAEALERALNEHPEVWQALAASEARDREAKG